MRRILPEAENFKYKDMDQALAACLREQKVLVIPEASSIPVEAWDPLEDFLNEGGSLVMWGLDPFGAKVSRNDGEFVTENVFFEQLAATARELPALKAIQIWEHSSDERTAEGKIRIARDRTLLWTGIDVDVKDFRKTDRVSADIDSVANMGITENSIALFARGDADTPSIVLELVEKDGTEWFYVIRASDKWQLHVIHEKKFRLSFSKRTKVGSDRRLDLSNLASIRVGLNSVLAPQSRGKHSYGVSEPRFVNDERSETTIFGWPQWSRITHSDLQYNCSGERLRGLGRSESLSVSGKRFQSPVPGPRGIGARREGRSRWIPLFAVEDEEGRTCGWPASIFIEDGEPAGTRTWGWVATPAARDYLKPLHTILRQTVDRLQREAFLLYAGCDRFVFRPGEVLRVEAGSLSRKTDLEHSRMTAFLMDGDRIVRRALTTLPSSELNSLVKTSLNLGIAPAAGSDTSNYVVRVTLEGDTKDADISDLIEQTIKVIGERKMSPESRLMVVGQGFHLWNRSIFLLGTRYQPASRPFPARPEVEPDWLTGDSFDPEIVRRDLACLKNIRVNALWVDYRDPGQAPQLRFFAEEAWIRDMGLVVHMPGLSPTDFDPEKAAALIRAFSFNSTPGVLAIEIASSLDYGDESSRRTFDEDWRTWLKEQYGTIEHAESVVGTLPRNKGNITGPGDAEIAKADSAMVTAYKAFLADWTSRRFGAIRRFLRNEGVEHLLAAGSDYATPVDPFGAGRCPADPASGMAHVDFFTPRSFELPHDGPEPGPGSFMTEYDRGMSGGKPVVWMSRGSWPDADPQYADAQYQRALVNAVVEETTNSHAAGLVVSRLLGKQELHFGTDLGLCDFDGRLRPAAEAVKQFAHDLRSRRPGTLPASETIAVRRHTKDADLANLWKKWSLESAGGNMRIQPEEHHVRSTLLIPASLSGGEPKMPCPLKSLNAEWGSVRSRNRILSYGPHDPIEVMQDQKIELEIINTGSATWVGSEPGLRQSVWIYASSEGRAPLSIRIPDLRFGESASAEWTPAESGIWHLRARLLDVGDFGEELVVNVN
ncbi:MAG: hypothetical protein KJ626_11840 [Verrucomicrobia bacterium]|nr:hypothetical protein [Verrucomicrobiota bacterium]